MNRRIHPAIILLFLLMINAWPGGPADSGDYLPAIFGPLSRQILSKESRR